MIAVTSCWHLQGERLEDRLYWVERALAQMSEAGVRAILHCGDLFHYARIGTKEAPAPVVIEGLKRVLGKFRLPLFLAEGNHDQVEGYDSSAVRALDGLEQVAHMGRLPSFELPLYGFEDVGFVALDWQTRMDVPTWCEQVRERVTKTGKSRVVVFGHVDCPTVSGLDLPNARWPRPTLEDLGKVKHEGVEVTYFFGHNHMGLVTPTYKGLTTLYGAPALARLRWDEAKHPDGWFLLGSDLKAKHVPLEGPRFLNLDESLPIDLDSVPRMSRVRVSSETSERLSHLVGSLRGDRGAYVEVVPAPIERSRSEVSPSSAVMGMSPSTLLAAWCYDNKVSAEGPLEELRQLLHDVELPGKSEAAGVESVLTVGLSHHAAFRHKDVSFNPTGWTCLVGPTGCGKSSLLESVYAALYGSWASTYRSGTTKFWQPFDEAGGAVSAVVRLRDETVLDVVRSRDGSTPSLTVDVNEHPLVPYTQPKKVQPALDPLVDDPDLWLRSGFLTQDHEPDLVESPPEERLKAFNRVLGIEEVAAVRALVADQLKALAPLQKQYEAECAEAEELTSGLADDEKQLFQLGARIQTEQGSAKAARAQADAAGELYRKSHLVSEVAHLKRSLEGCPTQSKVESAEEHWRQTSVELKDAKDKLDTEERHAAIQREGLQAEADLKCVGCWPNLLPCKLIDKARGQKAAGESMGTTPVDPSYARHDYQAAQERNRQARDEAAELRHKFETAANTTVRLKKLEAEVPEVTQTITQGEFAILRSAADQLEAEVRRLENERTYLRAQMDLRRRRRDELVGYAVQKSEKLSRLPHLRVLEQAFARSGVQRSLVGQGLPGIQEQLDRFTARDGLTDLRIHLDYAASDPKAAPTVLLSVRGGPWTEARPRSGGQRAIARLLVRLACCLWVHRCTGRRSVLVLDEPTAGVSESYADALALLLTELVGPDRPFTQGLLATHDEGFAQMIGNVKRVTP